MNEAIITTIISSICVLLGSVITVVVSNSRNRAVTELEQNHIKESLKELAERVDEHNNYAIEIPLIQQDIKYIKEKLNDGRN